MFIKELKSFTATEQKYKMLQVMKVGKVVKFYLPYLAHTFISKLNTWYKYNYKETLL